MFDEFVNPANLRPSAEIRLELASLDTARIKTAYALSNFVSAARLPPDYIVAPIWEQLVRPSTAGKRQVTLLDDSSTYVVAEQHLALLCTFYHHELLIDLDAFDIEGVSSVISEEASRLRIRWPYIWGRQLYDKFNLVASPQHIDHLPSDGVFPLLDETPQGVFQIGEYVSGPLGLLKARQLRRFPPRRRAGLWHCSDPGCRALHNVDLLQPEIGLIQLRRKLAQAARETLGLPSGWARLLGHLVEGPVGPKMRSYYDVPVLVAECILSEDRSTLVERALRGSYAGYFRDLIRVARGSDALAGAPRSIAERLNPEEQLQLLFCLQDDELVKLIDQCVFDRNIVIPANEERRPKLNPPKRYFIEAPSSLSSLGLREVISGQLASLCRLIWEAYNRSSTVSELDWRVKNIEGVPTQQALLRYLHVTSPGDAIKELILSSGPITSYAVNELQYSGDLHSADTISRILWKLGFEVARFSETYKRVRARLQSFTEVVLQVEKIRTEDDREKIRSAGVNLFVSIEQILEELVSYNVWLLGSDHFLGSLFVFDWDDAKKAVAAMLGESITHDADTITWKIAAENTLGTLYSYLGRAATWMKDLLSVDRGPLLRPAEDLPHYVKVHEKSFPFLHKEFWADVHPSALSAHVEDFQRLSRKLFQSNASAIRNGLDHQRPQDEFPEIDAMLAFATRFKEALDHADIQRYLPKEYWATRITRDEFDREEYHLRDYAKRAAVIYMPSFAAGIPRLEPSQPMLVAPGNLLAHLGATLTFRIRPKSNYAEYWEGYPGRRVIADELSDPTASAEAFSSISPQQAVGSS